MFNKESWWINYTNILPSLGAYDTFGFFSGPLDVSDPWRFWAPNELWEDAPWFPICRPCHSLDGVWGLFFAMAVQVGTWVTAASLEDNLAALLLVFSGYLQIYRCMIGMQQPVNWMQYSHHTFDRNTYSRFSCRSRRLILQSNDISTFVDCKVTSLAAREHTYHMSTQGRTFREFD